MSFSTAIRWMAPILGVCAALAGPALARDGGLSLGVPEGASTTASGSARNWLSLDDPPAAETGPISGGTKYYFRLAGWYTQLNGDLGYGTAVNGVPENVDLDDTLGYDTDLVTLRGQFGFTFGDRFHLDFAVNGPFNYDGNTTQSISFGDYSYRADARTELDFLTLEGDFSYDVVKQEEFRLGIGAGLRAVALHFEAEGTARDNNGNPVGTRKEDLDAGVALPVVGANIRWDLGRNFYIAAKAMGLYVGNYGNTYDLSAELGWDFTKNFGLFAGYKFGHFEAHDIEIDHNDLDIDSDLSGPYAGVEVRF